MLDPFLNLVLPLASPVYESYVSVPSSNVADAHPTHMDVVPSSSAVGVSPSSVDAAPPLHDDAGSFLIADAAPISLPLRRSTRPVCKPSYLAKYHCNMLLNNAMASPAISYSISAHVFYDALSMSR